MLLNLTFEEIMLNSPHYVFWKDKNSVYLGCNQNFAELAGFDSPEKIIGKTDFELAWDSDGKAAEIFRFEDVRTIQGDLLVNAVGYIHNADHPKVLLTNKTILKNKRHQIIGLFGISIDSAAQRLNLASYRYGLSPRQTQCLYHLVRGMTAKQIAKALNLSNRTVEAYLVDLKDKLRCDNKSDLVAKAIEMGFGNI